MSNKGYQPELAKGNGKSINIRGKFCAVGLSLKLDQDRFLFDFPEAGKSAAILNSPDARSRMIRATRSKAILSFTVPRNAASARPEMVLPHNSAIRSRNMRF